MANIIRLLGFIALVIGAMIMLIGYVGVFISDGFWAMMNLFNPFNLSNFVATILTLAPGGLLLFIADKLESKN